MANEHPPWPTDDTVGRTTPRYDYQYARAEAALSRLRAAVKLLKLIVTVDRGGLPDTVMEAEAKLDKIKSAGQRAREGLEAIGPIPD